jgi:hypothetical protein
LFIAVSPLQSLFQLMSSEELSFPLQGKERDDQSSLAMIVAGFFLMLAPRLTAPSRPFQV